MNVRSVCLSLIFLGLAGFGFAQIAVQTPNDFFWISYQTNDAKAAKVATYLMEIDSTGNVIREPKKVAGGLTISQHGANQINLWDWSQNQRAVIDKRTLNVVKTIKTTIQDVSFATQKDRKNFVASSYPYGRYFTPTFTFFEVSPTGVPSRVTWTISTKYGTFCDSYPGCPAGAISSDGKNVLWLLNGFGNLLTIQRLKPSGKPDGSDRQIGQPVPTVLYGGAISNVLADERVIVVYLTRNGDGHPNQLFLQAVHARTGQTIGDSILIKKRVTKSYNYPSILSPILAIDPSARFVIYQTGKSNAGSLKFQALDVTGHPSGTDKLLVKFTARPTGISLLKD